MAPGQPGHQRAANSDVAHEEVRHGVMPADGRHQNLSDRRARCRRNFSRRSFWCQVALVVEDGGKARQGARNKDELSGRRSPYLWVMSGSDVSA